MNYPTYSSGFKVILAVAILPVLLLFEMSTGISWPISWIIGPLTVLWGLLLLAGSTLAYQVWKKRAHPYEVWKAFDGGSLPVKVMNIPILLVSFALHVMNLTVLFSLGHDYVAWGGICTSIITYLTLLMFHDVIKVYNAISESDKAAYASYAAEQVRVSTEERDNLRELVMRRHHRSFE